MSRATRKEEKKPQRAPRVSSSQSRVQKRTPTWSDYQRCLSQVDSLKVQLPVFGGDRMNPQFYSLIDPPTVDEFSNTPSYSPYELASQPVDYDEVDVHSLPFKELHDRYILRALVSAFDVFRENDHELGRLSGTTTTTTSDNIAITGNNNNSDDDYDDEEDDDPLSQHEAGTMALDSYLERATRLFGRVSVAVLRQVAPFRLEERDGRCFTVTNTGTVGTGFISNRTMVVDRTIVAMNKIRRELAVRARDIVAVDRLVPSCYSCPCCSLVTRIFVSDQRDDTAIMDSFQRAHRHLASTTGTSVTFYVQPLLYHYVPAEEFREHFSVPTVCRRLKHRQLTETQYHKTRLVQRMAFYRRAYALHAALYVTVLWLWGRQRARHETVCGLGDGTPLPPIHLVTPRRLRPLFRTVDTMFLQLLLRQRKLVFSFV